MWLSGLRTQHSIREDAGSIPGLSQRLKDLALPCVVVLQVTDVAPSWRGCGCGIGSSCSSNWTPSLAMSICCRCAVKRKKKRKKERKKKEIYSLRVLWAESPKSRYQQVHTFSGGSRGRSVPASSWLPMIPDSPWDSLFCGCN